MRIFYFGVWGAGSSGHYLIVAQVCTFNEILALFAEHFPAQHARQPTLTLMSTLEDGAK